MATIDVTGLPEDKVKHLEQLIEGWMQDAANAGLKTSQVDLNQTWNAFFQVGDAITEQDMPDQDTLTRAVLSMRR